MALPAMQHASDAKHCRRCGAPYRYDAIYLGHLGPLPLRQLRRDAPRAAGLGPRHRARGGARRALHAAHAGRRSQRSRCPCPGSTTSTTPSAAAALALALGAPLDEVDAGLHAVSPAFGRAETLRVADRDMSILLVKNPAGANEVLRTLTLEDGEHDVFAVLNDNIADGRDVSWVWDADFEVLAPRVRRATCSGTRAAEMALRLKYAGVPTDRIAVEPELGGGPGSRPGRRRRPALRPAHLHRDAGAARPARRARRRARLVRTPPAASPGTGSRQGGPGGPDRGPVARPRVRRLRPRPAAVARAGRPRGLAGARRRRRDRARRARPRPPRATRSWRSTATPGCSPRWRDRGAGLSVSPVRGRRPRRSTSAGASRWSSCRCRRSSCSAARGPRALPAPARAPTWRPAGCWPRRWPTPSSPSTWSTTSRRSPTCARSAASSTPAARSRCATWATAPPSSACARSSARDGTRTVSGDVIELDRVDVDELAAEAAAFGLRAEPPRRIPQTVDYVGSTVAMLRA